MRAGTGFWTQEYLDITLDNGELPDPDVIGEGTTIREWRWRREDQPGYGDAVRHVVLTAEHDKDRGKYIATIGIEFYGDDGSQVYASHDGVTGTRSFELRTQDVGRFSKKSFSKFCDETIRDVALVLGDERGRRIFRDADGFGAAEEEQESAKLRSEAVEKAVIAVNEAAVEIGWAFGRVLDEESWRHYFRYIPGENAAERRWFDFTQWVEEEIGLQAYDVWRFFDIEHEWARRIQNQIKTDITARREAQT